MVHQCSRLSQKTERIVTNLRGEKEIDLIDSFYLLKRENEWRCQTDSVDDYFFHHS